MRIITFDPKNKIKATRIEIWDNSDLAENANEVMLVEIVWSNGARTQEGLPTYEDACEYANRVAQRSGLSVRFN